MNSSRTNSIIISVISLGLIAAFAYYLHANADKYLSLFHLSPIAVVFLFVLSVMSSILNGIINTYLFRSLDAEISHQDGFLLAAVTSLANQLPIFGGIIFKGYYLKRKFNLSYTKYLSATLALFIYFVAGNGLVGLVILSIWIFFQNLSISPFLVIGFAVMAASISFFWLPFDHIKLPDRLQKRLHAALEGWTIMSKSPLLTIELIGLQTSMILLLATQYWIAFHMLSQSVSMSQTMLFASAALLSLLVSFAPGGLGVTEAIVVAIASTLGFDIGVSVVAMGLVRLVWTFATVLIGGISTAIIARQIPEFSWKANGPDV